MSIGYDQILEELQQHTVVRDFSPNEGGESRFQTTDAYEIVLAGANHSGKTYSGMIKDALHIIPEIDENGKKTGFTINPFKRIRIKPGPILGWISTYSQDVQEDTIQPLIDPIFGPYIQDAYTESGIYYYINFKGGGHLNFKWQKQGIGAYPGAKVDFIHLDEPHAEAIYNECKARIAKKQGYMWSTLTPIISLKDNPSRAKDVIWMAKKIIEPWHRDPSRYPLLDVIYINLEENQKYINTDHMKKLWANMSEDEYRIRTTGQFISLVGDIPFSEKDLDSIEEYLLNHPEISQPEYGHLRYENDNPDREVYFEPNYQEDVPNYLDAGYIYRVWQKPVKEQMGVGPRYFIGADIAEGIPGGDYTSVTVKRGDSREVVCELHGYMTENTAAREIVKLGRWYSDPTGKPATVAVEVTGIGKVTQNNLMNGNIELNIPKYHSSCIYIRPSSQELNMGINAPGDQFGWHTNNATRHLLISEMRNDVLLTMQRIRENKGEPPIIKDLRFIGEARTFLRSDTGKFEAYPGFHDDILVSDSISEMCRQQGGFAVPKIASHNTKNDFGSKLPNIYMDPETGKTIINIQDYRKKIQALRRSKAVNPGQFKKMMRG